MVSFTRLLLTLLLSCVAAAAQADTIVHASDYDAYWLWAGVRAGADLQHAKTIYVLQGEIGPDRTGAIHVKAQGGSVPGPHAAKLWLAYRVRSLEWTPEIKDAILRKLSAWRAQPGEVAGIQVDFDASTQGLKNYAAFLQDLRRSLPANCELSVTGLMDWASQATPDDLNLLSGTVDEIIFQTYRGRDTVADIDAYVARLGRLRIPFRLGLVEGATWAPHIDPASNPHFQGYVIFLRNDR